MITSAENRRWDDDIVVSDLGKAGLPAPSVIRCVKIATIEAQDAERIGTLAQGDRKKVAAYLARILAGVGSARARGK
jgi:mRNA interferase MazF